VATDDYEAWLHRKLYVYSAGHAATAYLGYLKGYHYIHSAIRDPEIRTAARAAMAEGQRGVAARYGSAVAGGEAELDAILARFENAALNDSVCRVGRDPRRKLAADDRLVGAARLAAAGGSSPERLLLAVAAALCFCDPVDALAAELHREIERRGLDLILATVCGLEPHRDLGRLVLDRWRALSRGWGEGNLLLHLEAPMWAWTSDRAA
jgi:mannitol-1-phosphate 5-dehydrogenase